MVITVRLVGAFRHYSGTSKMAFGCKRSDSIGEMVNELVEKVPEIKSILIDQQLEDLMLNALILVNGREINVLHGLETKLTDGDEVVLIPVVHGG